MNYHASVYIPETPPGTLSRTLNDLVAGAPDTPTGRRLRVRTPEEHRQGCRTRTAATCAVPIECEHGYDVCPRCDPCTCAEIMSRDYDACVSAT